jgi:putative ABC transport system permease protein
MLRNYLRMAVKVLLRRKLFTAISLFGITFTLLVLVLVAALLDHGLGPVGPEVRQDRTLIAEGNLGEGTERPRQRFGLGYQLLDHLLRDLPGAERMSIFLEARKSRGYRGGYRIDSGLKLTDGDFWKILAFTFIEGGPFTGEDVRQASPVAVISETTRQRFFDGSPALGRWLELEGRRLRVVGVVRDSSPIRQIPWADVWAPITTSKHGLAEVSGEAQAIVLARTRGDFRRITDELDLRLARWDSPDPRKYRRLQLSLDTHFARIVDQLDHELFGNNDRVSHAAKLSRLSAAAMAISLLFMLLPAVNLVNLNVSRILERASEIGVRKSCGASSRALVAQFVVENVVLTFAGGGLALLLSGLVLGRLSATGLLGAERLAVSGRVFLVGLGLALTFGLVSGVYPAWKMARMHPLAALRGAVR